MTLPPSIADLPEVQEYVARYVGHPGRERPVHPGADLYLHDGRRNPL